VNPTLKLSLPALRPRRERVPRATEAAALIAALALSDRAVWATALYAGLRRGELQALDWSHVDLEAG
jgi:integrase